MCAAATRSLMPCDGAGPRCLAVAPCSTGQARLLPGGDGHSGGGAASGGLNARRPDVHDRPFHGTGRSGRDRRLIWAGRVGRVGQCFARPLRGGERDDGDRHARGALQGIGDRAGRRWRDEPPPAVGGAVDAADARRRRSASARRSSRADRTSLPSAATEWAFDAAGHVWMLVRSPRRAPALAKSRRGLRPTGARRLRCFTASARHPAAPVGRCGSSRHSRTLAVLATETCW